MHNYLPLEYKNILIQYKWHSKYTSVPLSRIARMSFCWRLGRRSLGRPQEFLFIRLQISPEISSIADLDKETVATSVSASNLPVYEPPSFPFIESRQLPWSTRHTLPRATRLCHCSRPLTGALPTTLQREFHPQTPHFAASIWSP